MENRRIVITGMGVISPVGNDIETFWNSLINGICGIDFIKRINTDNLPIKIGGEVKDFDPSKYGIDPGFIRRNDMFSVYALAAANQAMFNNVDFIDPERLGVYVGSGIGGFDTTLKETRKCFEEGPKWVSPYMIPSMISNMAAGNIAIHYNACGPCLPIVTACATGTHAIGEAYRAIKHGYADAIIAGGSECAINQLSIAGFANCKALSKAEDPKEASLPFDKRRQGFVIAEGAGIVLLEEYEHAKSRNATIYAEICGYGNTCDAHHVTAPHPEGTQAARAIKMALDEAGYNENDVLYVNAHGTGTPLNDSSETKALKIALGEEAARKAHISSTKSMTGHLLGATGAVEIIASALAIQNGIVPPTISLNEPDPECDLDYTPNKAVKADLTIANCEFMGIHTKDFGETAYLQEELNRDVHWYTYLNELAQQENGVILSKNLAAALEVKVGDVVDCSRYGDSVMKKETVRGTISGKVVAVVDAWPGFVQYTYEDGEETEHYLIVANYAKTVQSFKISPYEIWYKLADGVDSDAVRAVIDASGTKLSAYTALDRDIDAMKETAMIRITNGMFTLSFVIALILCMIGFLIYWISSIRQRELLFGVYRAMGLSEKEINRMLVNEHLFSTLPSILAGGACGGVATYLFVRLFGVIYLPQKHNLSIYVYLDQMDVLKLVAVLMVMILLCIVILRRLVRSLNITQALKLGEE